MSRAAAVGPLGLATPGAVWRRFDALCGRVAARRRADAAVRCRGLSLGDLASVHALARELARPESERDAATVREILAELGLEPEDLEDADGGA